MTIVRSAPGRARRGICPAGLDPGPATSPSPRRPSPSGRSCRRFPHTQPRPGEAWLDGLGHSTQRWTTPTRTRGPGRHHHLRGKALALLVQAQAGASQRLEVETFPDPGDLPPKKLGRFEVEDFASCGPPRLAASYDLLDSHKTSSRYNGLMFAEQSDEPPKTLATREEFSPGTTSRKFAHYIAFLVPSYKDCSGRRTSWRNLGLDPGQREPVLSGSGRFQNYCTTATRLYDSDKSVRAS